MRWPRGGAGAQTFGVCTIVNCLQRKPSRRPRSIREDRCGGCLRPLIGEAGCPGLYLGRVRSAWAGGAADLEQAQPEPLLVDASGES